MVFSLDGANFACRVIVASVVRVVRISTILHEEDKTWASYDSSIWSAVEVDVGLICVSAPATRKLMKKIAPGFMRSFRGSDSNEGRSSSAVVDDAPNAHSNQLTA